MSDDKSPAFPFYPKDYESDENVKMMTLEQEGAFLRLLCHAWLHESIPGDVPSLAKICRVAPSKMARLWPGVKPCFHRDDAGRLVNRKLEKIREGQRRFRQERSESGRKGAARKWSGRMAQPENGDGSAIREPLADDGFRFRLPFPDTTEPPNPPPSAGGDSSNARDRLIRTATAATPERTLRDQVEELRRYGVSINEVMHRSVLRRLRDRLRAGLTVEELREEIKAGDYRRRPPL